MHTVAEETTAIDGRIDEVNKQIDELKKQRTELLRSRPPEAIEDYSFKASDGSTIRLSELFNGKPDLIVIHNMGQACPYCTLWADGFNGEWFHLADRAGFVLISPDSPEAQEKFALGRGWKFRTVSAQGTTFIKDMGFEKEGCEYWPGASAFYRGEDGKIVRTGRGHFGPGDDFCGVWPLLDLLKDGENGWEPKYRYNP